MDEGWCSIPPSSRKPLRFLWYALHVGAWECADTDSFVPFDCLEDLMPFLMSKSRGVRCFVRLPSSPLDMKIEHTAHSSRIQVMLRSGVPDMSTPAFQCSRCFVGGPQDEVCNVISGHTVDEVWGGRNACFVAAGVEGTPQTLIPRIAQALLARTVWEDKAAVNLSVMEMNFLGLVELMTSTPVTTMVDVMNLLTHAEERRSVDSSSNGIIPRSHLVVTLGVTRTLPSRIQNSKICFIDIVDSGPLQSMTDAVEAAALNKAKASLGAVLAALRDKNTSVCVPFRDSALTLMLKDCMAGPMAMAPTVIATVYPAPSQETKATLKFATGAMKMKK